MGNSESSQCYMYSPEGFTDVNTYSNDFNSVENKCSKMYCPLLQKKCREYQQEQEKLNKQKEKHKENKLKNIEKCCKKDTGLNKIVEVEDDAQED